MGFKLTGFICFLSIILLESCLPPVNCHAVKVYLITDEPVLEEDVNKLHSKIVELAEPFIQTVTRDEELIITPVLDIRSTRERLGVTHTLNITSAPSAIKKVAGTYECSDGVQDYEYWKNEGGYVNKGEFVFPERDSSLWSVEDLGFDTSEYVYISYSSLNDINSEELRTIIKANNSKGIILYKNHIKRTLSITCARCEHTKVGDEIILKANIDLKAYKGSVKWYLDQKQVGSSDKLKYLLTHTGDNNFVVCLDDSTCASTRISVTKITNPSTDQNGKIKVEKPAHDTPDELTIQLHLEKISWTKGFDSYSIRITRESTGGIVLDLKDVNSSALLISNLNSKFGDNTLYIIEVEGKINGVVQKSEQTFWLIKNQTSIDPQCIKRSE